MLAIFLILVTMILLASSQQLQGSAWPIPNWLELPTLWGRIPSVVPATVGANSRSATSAMENNSSIASITHAAARVSRPAGPESSREARRGGRDPLRNHRATVGRDAKTPWFVPIRSLILLLLLIAAIGMAIAGATLLVIGSGRFVLEILAG